MEIIEEISIYIFYSTTYQPSLNYDVIILAKPMEPSTASRIRNICRVCRKRRYRLVSGQIDENELTMLNLIIVIIGHYFEQIDLQDNNSPTPTQGAANTENWFFWES